MAAPTVKQQIEHYTFHDPPMYLRLLAKAARAQRRPVALVWLDGENDECRETVGVVAIGPDWLRIATADGVEQTLNAWDVIDARLLAVSEAMAA